MNKHESKIKQAAKDYTDSLFGAAAINHFRSQIEHGFIAGAEANEPKWIPISERLPEIGQCVIVILDGGTWFKGQLLHDGWVAFFADGRKYCDEPRSVTHWLSESVIPSPPNTQP